MSCFTTECPDEVCYITPICPKDYLNRVVFDVFYRNTRAIDKSTATAWLNSILLAELYGDAVVIRNVSGELPAPTVTEIEGYGRSPGTLGAKRFTLTAADRNGVVNAAAYNAFLRTSDQFDFYFGTPDLIFDASGNTLKVNGDNIITKDILTYITGQLIVEWNQIGIPLPCEFKNPTTGKGLDVALNAGLYYVVSNAYDPGFQIGVTVNEETNTTFTAALNQTVTGDLPDVVWSISGDAQAIADFALVMDPVTGVLTINASQEGSVTIAVIASNEVGCVTGSQNVVITSTNPS